MHYLQFKAKLVQPVLATVFICRVWGDSWLHWKWFYCRFGPTVTSPLPEESSVLGNGSKTTDVFVEWLSRNGNYRALVCVLSLGLGGGTDKKSEGHLLANMSCHPPVTTMTTLTWTFDDRSAYSHHALFQSVASAVQVFILHGYWVNFMVQINLIYVVTIYLVT